MASISPKGSLNISVATFVLLLSMHNAKLIVHADGVVVMEKRLNGSTSYDMHGTRLPYLRSEMIFIYSK